MRSVAKQRYKGAAHHFEYMDEWEKGNFLYENTVLSAQFDSEEVALENISRFVALDQRRPANMKSARAPHFINIAKGWVALNSGDIEEATRYLLKSTKTNGPPTLTSFGPDITLIRALYQRRHKKPVLDYLARVQAFWDKVY